MVQMLEGFYAKYFQRWKLKHNQSFRKRDEERKWNEELWILKKCSPTLQTTRRWKSEAKLDRAQWRSHSTARKLCQNSCKSRPFFRWPSSFCALTERVGFYSWDAAVWKLGPSFEPTTLWLDIDVCSLIRPLSHPLHSSPTVELERALSCAGYGLVSGSLEILLATIGLLKFFELYLSLEYPTFF